jgi:ribosomal protein S27AE
MTDTPKRHGVVCPRCEALFPAEYAQMGQTPRWSCQKCGAGGPLLGGFDGRKPASEPVAAPQVKKHWSSQ